MYLTLTLIFLNLVYLWETYLDYRQYQKLKETQIPKELRSLVNHEKYFQTQLYNIDNAKFEFITKLYNHLESIILLYFCVGPWVWEKIGNILLALNYKTEVCCIIISLTK